MLVPHTAETQNNPHFAEIAQACRAVYLSSDQINSALNAFLEVSDAEFRARIKHKIAMKFDNELKAFCCVRDAIVLSTFSDTFSDKKRIKEYIDHLVEREDDSDIRELRITMLNAIESIH